MMPQLVSGPCASCTMAAIPLNCPPGAGKERQRMSNTPPPALGATISEGKTKRIVQVKDDPRMVALCAKDDITAGDGAKHDIIPDKGRIANQTTCNVFRLLQAAQIPVAFEEQG